MGAWADHHHDAGYRVGAAGGETWESTPNRSPADAHRLSTHQFNAISLVMANTCLPPSSSRLMIHRHTSVASRSRNARGMLGTVSSPIAQRAAAKRAAEASRAGSETPKRCTITLPYRGEGHTALPPVCSPARRSPEQTECLLRVCVCVCARARVCVCVCVLVDQAHTQKKSKRHFLLLFG